MISDFRFLIFSSPFACAVLGKSGVLQGLPFMLCDPKGRWPLVVCPSWLDGSGMKCADAGAESSSDRGAGGQRQWGRRLACQVSAGDSPAVPASRPRHFLRPHLRTFRCQQITTDRALAGGNAPGFSSKMQTAPKVAAEKIRLPAPRRGAYFLNRDPGALPPASGRRPSGPLSFFAPAFASDAVSDIPMAFDRKKSEIRNQKSEILNSKCSPASPTAFTG